MGFHPLGTARAHRNRARGRRRRRPAVHGVTRRPRRRRRAVPGPLGVNPQITIMALATRLARPPDADGGARLSFLIDPPWLYANGRAYAAARARTGAGPHAAAAGAATMAVVLGRERLALPQQAVDAAGSGRRAGPATAATGCSTRASCGSTSARPRRRPTRLSAALFATYPLLALARLARRAAAR